MKTEYKIIVLSILLGLFLWVVDAALDYFIYYQGTFWGLLIYEIPPHEIYVRTLVLGSCFIFGVAISTVFRKFRRAEEKRRESEKQLRLAVKNSRDVLYKLNLRTGDFDYVSPSVVELGGYTPQEFILLGVKGVLRRIDPEDRHRFMMHFRNVLRQAVEDGLAPTIEYRWKHNNGEYRWFSDSRAVIRDDDGNPISVVGTIRDVTEEKRGEWALRESEAKYRTLIETAQEGVAITSPGEELVFVNKAFASILGYEPSELVGRNLREFVTGEQFEDFKTETEKRQWGTSSHYETEMRHRDGSHRSLLVSASPLYDREGNYNRTLGMVVDITERKKAEEALRQQTRDLGERVKELNCVYGISHLLEKPGICLEEIIQGTVDLIPTSWQYPEITCARIVLEGQEFRTESFGETVWKQASDISIHDAIVGNIQVYYSEEKPQIDEGPFLKEERNLIDAIAERLGRIVERKRAEQALQESEEKYRLVSENVPVVIYSALPDEHSTTTLISGRILELTGYSHEEFVEDAELWTQIVHPDDREYVWREIEEHREKMALLDVEYRITTKDNTVKWVRDKATPMLDENGQIARIDGFMEDITERKRAEEALRESEERLRSVFESQMIGILFWDADGDITDANDAFLEMLGYTKDEILSGKVRWRDMTPPEYKEQDDKALEEVAATGVMTPIEKEYIRKDGNRIPIFLGAAGLPGPTLSGVAFVIDITERKHAEEALRQRTHDLGERVKELNCLYGASRLMAQPGVTLEEALQGVAELILPGWQYPEITCARILFGGGEFTTSMFRETEWKQSADIVVSGENVGTIEVFYLEEKPEIDEGPFLKEERNLIDALASRIGKFIDRKRAEETVQNVAAEWESTFNSITDLVSVHDEDFRLIRVNRVFADLLKMKPEELVGKKCYEVVHGTERPPADCPHKQMLESKKAVTREFFDPQQGAYLQASASPIFDEDGELAGSVHIVKDITERKKAEEALQESEERYRSFVQNFQGIAFRGNKDFDLEFFHGSVQGLTGYAEEDFVEGRVKWHEIVHKDDLPKFLEDVEKVISQEHQTAGREYRIVRRDGEIVWVHEQMQSVFDDSGGVIGAQGTIHDITERKKAEEALQESEAKWRSITENSPDHIMLLDREANIQFFNQTVPDLTKEEVIGTPIYNYVPEDYRPVMKESFERVMKTGEPDQYEVEYKSADGSTQVYETSVGPVLRGDEVVALTLSSRDITERKKAEEALRQSEKQASTAIEAAKAFTFDYNIATAKIDWGGAIEEITGYTPEEFAKIDVDGWAERIHPDDRDRILSILQEAMGKDRATAEYRFKTKKGYITLSSISLTEKQDGKAVRLVGILQDISERKKAEQKLQESEERFRSIVEAAPSLLLITDAEGNNIYVSPNCEEILGYSPEELKGRRIWWVHEDDTERAKETFERTYRDKVGGRNFEYKAVKKNGEVWYASSSWEPLVDEKGEFQGVVLQTVNITERKKAEEALREAKEFSESLIVFMQDGFSVLDSRGVHIEVNPAFCKMTGFSREELIGVGTPHPYWPPEALEEIENAFQKTTQQEFGDLELTFMRKNGERFPAMVSPSCVKDKKGNVVSYFATVRDITERKQAEEALRDSEEKHRTLLGNLPQKIFYKDRDSVYVSCNENYASDLGIKPDEIAGKTDYDFYPKGLAEKYRADDRRLMESGEVEDIEERYIQHGKELTVYTVKTPVRDEEGNVVGILGIFWDITEQRSLEEQFRQAQKMESLGTLAGGVAHDFNNLLGGILGYVGLMKGDYSPGEKHYAMLELVEKAGVRAAELTNQLLAFSRKGKFELRAVDLNNSVEDVLKLLGRTLDKNIEIVTELQEKLPSVEGDPGQLEQAILNLCVNAAEAMPGGGKLQLETRVVALEEEFARKYLGSDPGDYVLLSVSDTGIGMDSETLSRMFEPFFTTKEVGKGTGLGLSTVYGIVKNHGGYVDVRSQPGKGSTFDIYLPVSKKEFTPPQPRAAELQTGHETILAVDDEEIIRSLLEETLQKLGYKVILANDGEEAVQIYEERKDEIDAVIIDMIMPHVGGRETFREIKRRNPDVRVLLASGYSQDGAAQQILDEGVRGFIQKPFELVELSQKLRQVLD